MSRKCSIGAPAKYKTFLFISWQRSTIKEVSKWLSPLVYKKWLWICFCQHVIFWNAKSRSHFYKAKIFLNKKYTKKEKKTCFFKQRGDDDITMHTKDWQSVAKNLEILSKFEVFVTKMHNRHLQADSKSQIANAFSLIMCWFF